MGLREPAIRLDQAEWPTRRDAVDPVICEGRLGLERRSGMVAITGDQLTCAHTSPSAATANQSNQLQSMKIRRGGRDALLPRL